MPRREPQIHAGGIFCDVHALKKKSVSGVFSLYPEVLTCKNVQDQESHVYVLKVGVA